MDKRRTQNIIIALVLGGAGVLLGSLIDSIIPMILGIGIGIFLFQRDL